MTRHRMLSAFLANGVSIAILALVVGCWVETAKPVVEPPADGPGPRAAATGENTASNADGDRSTPANVDTADSGATSRDATDPTSASGSSEQIANERSNSSPSPRTATPRRQEPPQGPAKLISFDDLNLGMPPDATFRERLLEINAVTQQLIGRQVIVGGYMLPTDAMTGVTDFVLLRNLECKFGPGGQADHLVHVLMQGDASADFTDKVVYVEGTLVLNPYPPAPDPTWSIYDLHGVSVSKRPPDRSRR